MTNQTKWVLDPTHSEILFKVKHLMITNVKGEFRKYQGEMTATGDDFSKATVHVTIDAASVFTNEDNRDGHLKSADFFDVAQHPTITFEGTALTPSGDHQYHLTGLLTIRGVAKEITLDVTFGGINKDPWGNEKAGFSIQGKINRKDWGLTWNAPLETGGVLVSEDVSLAAEIQFVKQA